MRALKLFMVMIALCATAPAVAASCPYNNYPYNQNWGDSLPRNDICGEYLYDIDPGPDVCCQLCPFLPSDPFLYNDSFQVVIPPFSTYEDTFGSVFAPIGSNSPEDCYAGIGGVFIEHGSISMNASCYYNSNTNAYDICVFTGPSSLTCNSGYYAVGTDPFDMKCCLSGGSDSTGEYVYN